ncbi:MAG: tRNA (adenosine(37)-N6)-dimethylallyltransferase MiaA [candidate division WOR-3 bacterium]|nr:MAG: tRNA (adenosine(37)-N6)-dimethylallyltransferase MiaA [candidate division WOR-3 bacterium]
MNRILTIVGPTASGKTDLAIRIAQKTLGEIISADSRQIYRYLNIGTAKPDRAQQKSVTFHLIDFIEPDARYSCGQFARDAEQRISSIRHKGSIPIVCGGTGLYIKALFEPLHELPASDNEVKTRLIQQLRDRGINHLYQKLLDVDPVWAQRVGPRDTQRILRGLEIYEMTGKPLSTLLKGKRNIPKYLPYYIGLDLPREELYKRIDSRFDTMIAAGFVNEVRALLKKGFDPGKNALRTIGYKEIIEHLRGKCSLPDAVAKAKRRTRNFAKRQLTWFARIPGVGWYDPRDPHLVAHVVNVVRTEIG